MSVIITTPVGRLVGGHPMNANAVTDDITKLPKTQADGVTPRVDYYVGIAIQKGAETHWNQTPWGQLIAQEAAAGWPNGEFNAPTFAWKVTDGDSQIPNKNGKKPCDREGYPGHWVLNCSTGLAIKCFHAGRYGDLEAIQNKNEIKPGDYCRVQINCKANNPAQSPGVYLNPSLFELTRAGIQIQLGDGPDANEAFGGAAPAMPAGAQIDTAVSVPAPGGAAPAPTTVAPAPAPTTVAPAADFLNPGGAATPPTAAKTVTMYTHTSGQQFTKDALLASGWQEAQILALPHDEIVI